MFDAQSGAHVHTFAQMGTDNFGDDFGHVIAAEGPDILISESGQNSLGIGGPSAGTGVVYHFTSTVVSTPGDSNGDGHFNQLDIVQVLQAGKYLTGQPADRSQGDWSGDGLFNQTDIVLALQAGNYLK